MRPAAFTCAAAMLAISSLVPRGARADCDEVEEKIRKIILCKVSVAPEETADANLIRFRNNVNNALTSVLKQFPRDSLVAAKLVTCNGDGTPSVVSRSQELRELREGRDALLEVWGVVSTNLDDPNAPAQVATIGWLSYPLSLQSMVMTEEDGWFTRSIELPPGGTFEQVRKALAVGGVLKAHACVGRALREFKAAHYDAAYRQLDFARCAVGDGNGGADRALVEKLMTKVRDAARRSGTTTTIGDILEEDEMCK